MERGMCVTDVEGAEGNNGILRNDAVNGVTINTILITGYTKYSGITIPIFKYSPKKNSCEID